MYICNKNHSNMTHDKTCLYFYYNITFFGILIFLNSIINAAYLYFWFPYLIYIVNGDFFKAKRHNWLTSLKINSKHCNIISTYSIHTWLVWNIHSAVIIYDINMSRFKHPNMNCNDTLSHTQIIIVVYKGAATISRPIKELECKLGLH